MSALMPKHNMEQQACHRFHRASANPFIKTGLVAACSLASLLSTSPVNAQTAEPRWFEVEIILIQQLLDDASYNENFADLNIKASKSKKNIDLIYQHLRQINDFTYLLAPCGEDKSALPIALENEQPWQELILTMPENFGEEFDSPYGEPDMSFSYGDLTSTTTPVQEELVPEPEPEIEEPSLAADPLLAEQTPRDEFSQEVLDQIDLGIDFAANEDDHGLTPFTFNFYCHYTDSDTLLTSLDKQFYQIPRQIGGREDVYSSQPYMLTKESLELTHIYRSLRRSREFRPLLHMAWRQPVFDARKAVPVKLVAGPNLKYPKPDLNQQQVDNEQQSYDINDLEQQRQAILNDHINALINNLEQGNVDQQQLLASLKAGSKPDIITEQIDKQIELITNGNSETEQTDNLQDWLLEGFFKVHLDHYLFINSEFTMPVKTGGDSEEILVPFKQNRRVISGEIHYFDHPYMGMIVQIRRHSRPEPPAPEEQSDNNQ